MSAACTQFEEDVTPTYDTAAKPEVTATVVSDTEITVTVTAGAGTNFWGYAVMTGAPGATADKLVANGYAKAAEVVLQGEDKAPQAAQMKYSEETKTVTLNLTGLTPYTDYTVYAAAVSVMGVTSEVAEITVKTTDGTEPTVTAFNFAEADEVLTFAISFNDPVSLTGNGTAKAWFYAENYYDETGMLVLYKEVDIPATHIATNGKNLLVAVPATEYVPGAYVAVTYSAGIVKNGADAVNAAYETHVIGYDDKDAIQKKGFFGYYDYANWDFSIVDPATLPDDDESGFEGEEEEEEEKVPVYFSDWSKLMMSNYVVSDYPLAGKTGEGGVEITTSEASGKTISYPAKTFGVVDDFIAGVMLNEQPAYGSTVSYTIAEGTFCDIFGNVNNEFVVEDEYYFSYGYTMDDIIGTYQYVGISALGSTAGQPIPGKMTIEASDDEEKGNFMISSFAGHSCDTPIYGTFNPDSGSIEIYGEQAFRVVVNDNDTPEDESDDTEITLNFYTYQYIWLQMSMTESGYISGPNDIFGIYLTEGDTPLGWNLAFNDFEAVKVEDAPEAPEATSVKMHVNNLVELPFVEKK